MPEKLGEDVPVLSNEGLGGLKGGTESSLFVGSKTAKEAQRTLIHRCEQQKIRPAEAIAKDVMDVLNYGKESVSVAFGEVKSHNCLEKAYRPGVQGNSGQCRQATGIRCEWS